MATTAHWVADTAATHCASCKGRFDLVNRKHHCRLCGNVFCDDCSRWRITVRDLGVSDGRACEPCSVWVTQKLPLLQREAIFQKVDRDGTDHEVRLRVSPDQELLQWKSERFQFGVTEQVELDDFRTVVVGQQTDTFHSAHTLFFLTCCLGHGIQKFEDRSFSLVFADNVTLDLVALSVDAMEGWIDAFRELIARRKTASTTVIKSDLDRQRRESTQETQRNIRNKYASKGNELRAKYGATSK